MAQRPTVTQMSRKFKVTHLQGGSSKFYRDATKILRPPTSYWNFKIAFQLAQNYMVCL